MSFINAFNFRNFIDVINFYAVNLIDPFNIVDCISLTNFITKINDAIVKFKIKVNVKILIILFNCDFL